MGCSRHPLTINVITSSDITPNDEDTLNSLVDKHPVALPPLILAYPIVSGSVISTNEIILGRIRSFPKSTVMCMRQVEGVAHSRCS